MSDVHLSLLNDFQRGFPLTSAPFEVISRRLGMGVEELLDTLRRLVREGVISRVGAVFRPNRIGVSTLAAMAVPEARLAEVLAVSIKHVRLDVDARLAGGSNSHTPPVDVQSQSNAAANSNRVAVVSIGNGADPKEVSPQEPSTPAPELVSGRDDQVTRSSLTEAQITLPANATNPPANLKLLRDQSLSLAKQIAERHDLADCLAEAPDFGMGFLLDLPKTSLIPHPGQRDALDRLNSQWVWWLLLSLSEQVVHPHRLQQMPAKLALRDLILEKNDEQALAVVGEPDWKALAYEVLSNPAFDDHTIDEIIELARVCRRIRKLVHDDGGIRLWRGVPVHCDG